MLNNSILREFRFLALINIVTAGSTYFLTLFIARSLGPEEFGRYSLALTWAMGIALIVNFATDKTAPLRARENNKQEIYNDTVSLKAGATLLVFICSPFVFLYSSIAFYGVVLGALMGWSFSFAYEIEGKNIKYSFLYSIERYLYLILCLFLFYIFEASIYLVLISIFFSTILSLFIQSKGVDLRYRIGFEGKYLKRLSTIAFGNFVIVLTTLIYYVYGGFTRIYIDSQLGSAELGVFSASFQIIMIITLFQTQLDRIYRVKFSFNHSSGSNKTLAKMSLQYLAIGYIPVITIGGPIAYFSSELVGLVLGVEYGSVANVMPWFIAYSCVIPIDSLSRILWITASWEIAFFYLSSLFAITYIFILYFYIEPTLVVIAKSMIVVHVSCSLLLLFIYFKRSKDNVGYSR